MPFSALALRRQRLQDQLIIYMALACGTSRMVCAEPTLHTRTAMVVAETLVPGVKFTVTRIASGTSGGSCEPLYMVECCGGGVLNS